LKRDSAKNLANVSNQFALSADRRSTQPSPVIITIIGKAFWDIGHARKDQSDRRKLLVEYAVLGDSPRDETGYPMNRKQEIDCKVQSKSR
jgi:hypothetical protein